MNVTRRNNGLAITGTDNEIISLLASLEYGLINQANVENTFSDEKGKAALAEYMARYREAKRLRLLAEELHKGGGLSVEAL